ncbi:MAG TPA: CDP-diacylglycerol--serine O-phosphatidyltransferase [Myxococcales bacterium]|nr:CDP-diacylglycerol--serine O-phosphatidyltransferase [Myxococcales bacterium]HAN32394.1 CDP-diacylglycerol--serine O-phosphatidyltransferase [Myxococcales bacterium]
MLREFEVADLFTLANAACGTATLFLCLQFLAEGERSWLWAGFVLLPVAFVCDALDGWVARKLRRSSRLGADLDSLADIISFGVAPATLAYTLGARGGWDVLILIGFVCCGIARLARFNVTAKDMADEQTGKVPYFEGTPIPSSLVLVLLMAVAFSQDAVYRDLWGGVMRLGPMAWHPASSLFALSGAAMVSTRLRIPKP